MATTKTANERDNSRRCDLDDRYGEIGISAVAAAVRCRAEERSPSRTRDLPHESD